MGRGPSNVPGVRPADAGNITSRTYPDSTATSQTFDDDGRLLTVSSGGQTTTFGYDAAGNLTAEMLPSGNGHGATRTFDRAGRLTTVENAKAGTILSKFLWTLDAAGNPTKVQTTRGATDTYDAYDYDTRNRLTSSCFGVSSGATDCTGAANKITYAYDKVSNRMQEVRSGSVGNTGTIDYAYNAADQLTSTTKSGNTTNHTYDANGNQASIGARTFTYDLASRLVSTTNAGTTTTYAYDGDGRRVSSTVGGGGADLRYVWDSLADSGIPELALERTSGGSLVRRHLAGPLGAFSFTNSSVTFSYHRDPLGTISDVTDATGAAQWKYEYEAYGAERSATNVSGSAPENRLRFDGQYLDGETGQYHLRARQYDPATGRFGALDPVENPLVAAYDGAYAYASGRPTVLVDPLGLFYGWNDFKRDATTVGKAAVAGVARAPNPITQAYTTGKRFYDTYRTYQREGGGFGGAVEAFNQNWNPGYSFLVNQHLCRNGAGGSACANAFVDAATLAAGPYGIARGAGVARGCFGGAAKAGPGADSALQGALLREHLRLTEKYGTAGVRELQNGRIRYYGDIRPPRTPGEMAGQRTVREWDPATGRQRTWLETVDQRGQVRIVRPETGVPKTHYYFDESGGYGGSR
jgi:RHS repeat-associated protein